MMMDIAQKSVNSHNLYSGELMKKNVQLPFCISVNNYPQSILQNSIYQPWNWNINTH